MTSSLLVERLSTRSEVRAETRALKVLFHITEAHSQGGWVEQSETQRWNSLHSFQPTTASWLLMKMHKFNVDTAVGWAVPTFFPS